MGRSNCKICLPGPRICKGGSGLLFRVKRNVSRGIFQGKEKSRRFLPVRGDPRTWCLGQTYTLVSFQKHQCHFLAIFPDLPEAKELLKSLITSPSGWSLIIRNCKGSKGWNWVWGIRVHSQHVHITQYKDLQ